ncbi:MAG: asparagine--tRNA ligase [Candidatus Aenigmarchaeota archaeon]|nr:asparagine--tRNA ligase [Candidatus Aenigmarchaeota archaeon]
MTTIEEIFDGKFTGKKVTIRGWIHNKRDVGGIIFLLVRDGTGLIQCAVRKDQKEAFNIADKLTQESSVELVGTVKEDRRAPGGYELSIESVKVYQIAEEYLFGKKEHGPDFLLNHRHLWIRSERQRAILKVRDEIIKAIRTFFDDHDFVLVDAPILTPSACEETTTLFSTDYFGKKAYLSQSGQLYMEAAIAAFGKVYCFGPAFRAERSRTRRHLTEFWQVEPEIAFASLDDIIKIQEELVTYIVKRILERREKELKVIGRDIKPLEKVKPPFPKISYAEAVEILKKAGFKIEWGEDFGVPHERFLSQKFDRPLFVHRYPAKAKAFYMQPDPEDPKVVLCDDLLAPEGYGEIIGGSERIWDLDLLLKKVKEFKLPLDTYKWYIDLRRYGSVPHSGFGLGLERTVMWICGIDHIREAIPFPRLINRIYP